MDPYNIYQRKVPSSALSLYPPHLTFSLRSSLFTPHSASFLISHSPLPTDNPLFFSRYLSCHSLLSFNLSSGFVRISSLKTLTIIFLDPTITPGLLPHSPPPPVLGLDALGVDFSQVYRARRKHNIRRQWLQGRQHYNLSQKRLDSFRLAFSGLTPTIGPWVSPTERCKNCILTMTIHYPQVINIP